MKGMNCWTGEFAAINGAKQMRKDLAAARIEIVDAKKVYDELMAEHLKNEIAERRTTLTTLKTTLVSYENKIKTAKAAEATLKNATVGVTG
jgi:thymidylate synthase